MANGLTKWSKTSDDNYWKIGYKKKLGQSYIDGLLQIGKKYEDICVSYEYSLKGDLSRRVF